MKYLRLILIPFSFLYWLITFIRNKLYDSGVIKSYKMQVPVISIGNLTTGGTGKTPFTILIASHFLKKNLKAGIIARGYGRTSDEMVTVYDGKNILKNASLGGDELIEISNRLKNISENFVTVASSDRVKAAEHLVSKYKPDVILLDDAFQHRRIMRDIDVLIVDKSSKDVLDNIILPAGNLREGKSNIKRADIVIHNYKFTEGLAAIGGNEFSASYKVDISSLSGMIGSKEVVAVCAIARPDSFFKMLDELNITPKKKFIFKDHHNYAEEDINTIKNFCGVNDIILTTGKDMVKLEQFKNIFEETEIIPVNISASINNEEGFFKLLDKIITK